MTKSLDRHAASKAKQTTTNILREKNQQI
jgi:hypothetical protein